MHFSLCFIAILLDISFAARFTPDQVDYNLNTNQAAINPLDYSGEWQDHIFNPSPSNWRFPFYTFFLDRFVNGDPSNDNANGTAFEQDVHNNQLRHGGDIKGVVDSLDYLQGMGIKGLYVAGSPFLNQPWTADSYSPVDLTILDHHFGTIQDWRDVVTEVHSRGMYIVLDNTFATMGDLLGFQGYLNTTTPFTLKEHKVQWKSERRYLDFQISDNYNQTCDYPRFWNETGLPIDKNYTDAMVGCYNSDFDQYGDTEAFGVFPDYQRQLSKFASVQDRLRDWAPSVRDKVLHFSCLAIQMLDIDGFRFDKATQITVDAQGEFGDYMRNCAKKLGKDNFFMPGEITGGNTFGSIYLGRGRQPNMTVPSAQFATNMTSNSDSKYFIRDVGKNALDAAAFHYTIYRSLTRFLGMDGNLEAGYDANGGGWTEAWNTMMVTNDLVNANTDQFDPRHMFGVTNQDVFRWPAIRNGTQRMLLGFFVTTIHMPGIPLLVWGEEQAFYVLDSTASNYIYGRQPMTSSQAWQMHGCYHLGSTQYYQMPWTAARDGCNDDQVSLDHRDASAPVRNILKHMYHLRQQYPVLNDGWYLQELSKQTHEVQYPGSGTVKTETGIWSVLRAQFEGAQDLSNNGGQGKQPIWLIYHNENDTTTYKFDCSNNDTSFLSAFGDGTTVKNLFYPHEELTLGNSSSNVGFTGDGTANGCVDEIVMKAYEFKAYVPIDAFVAPPPMITKFIPGHDARVVSTVKAGLQETLEVEIHFSAEMDCDSVTSSIQLNSTTEDLRIAEVAPNSVQCSVVQNNTEVPQFIAELPTTWTWKAKLQNLSNGVHMITVRNATTFGSNASTNAVDHFMFRIGQPDNPMVFPLSANYTRALIHKDEKTEDLFISHKAAGADKWRYSLNWGSTWSNWTDYHGGNNSLPEQPWSGTKLQRWSDTHIIAQYWSRMSGSSSVVQHADLENQNVARRFPHLFAHGRFNQYGYDAGLQNQMKLDKDGLWTWHMMFEWPDNFQLNVWGMNPDGQPDVSQVFGDIDQDAILDRLPPSSLSHVSINASEGPPSPYLAYRFSLNDGTYKFDLIPVGNRWQQLLLYILLATIPVITGVLSVWAYMRGFYEVKFNEVGITEKVTFLALLRPGLRKRRGNRQLNSFDEDDNLTALGPPSPLIGLAADGTEKRRSVLIATMEYDIEDWSIKIKIGGLGVMAQLMGKNLQHQDLIWVVPCVGGIDYPIDTQAPSMEVTILGSPYEVQVQYHYLNNITYVLLDAPVFRGQSKSEPYPPRMDDLDSAIYYSAWNQCIAQAITRFNVDMYHINDYHGACAPLYLLPKTVPACLSLHNAEFQGLWPMRTPQERKEVCEVFNLDEAIVQQYVQFGSVFNLLHAGASYLRVHQKGVGAVGVSNKYGKRSWARYPIFWGLSKIGKLPNPDPTDTEAWDKQLAKEEDCQVDPAYEAGRGELKRQAQEWAGLEQRPDAELFVFVGRWSVQKGVDLIADCFCSVLETHEKAQLICVGPVIDLYGKFAALKLGRMMEKYPGRVFSKPEFTALPPYIFSGAEFALIPSRDEPFGLVAVEFGRKGALGVGARVGGLGQMPGWWYTVESTTSAHLIKQFKSAIDSALASSQETRAVMRARSAKQRFPVQQWKEDLNILQTNAIRIHDREALKGKSKFSRSHGASSRPVTPTTVAPPTPEVPLEWPLGAMGNSPSGVLSNRSSMASIVPAIPTLSNTNSPGRVGPGPSKLGRKLSMGQRRGPGHAVPISNNAAKNSPPRLGNVFEEPNRPESSYDDDHDFLEYYDEHIVTEEEIEYNRLNHDREHSPHSLYAPNNSSQNAISDHHNSPYTLNSPWTPTSGQFPQHRLGANRHSLAPSMAPSMAPSVAESEMFNPQTLALPSPMYMQNSSARSSVLSLDSVVGEKKDFKLQKVDPFFTDSTGEFYKTFDAKLDSLNGKNSETDFCIEEFLIKSEKSWFDRFRDARLGRSRDASGASRVPSPSPGSMAYNDYSSRRQSEDGFSDKDEFLLGQDYKPPTGLKKYMQMKVGDWPLYTIFLAFGQIISANSYQITLLTGSVGQAAIKLYIIATVYLISSIFWWIFFRRVKAVVVLSIPFIFYGGAFLLLGLAPFFGTVLARGWVQNIATGLYAIASSSGALFFALNFGDEGGAPVKDWIFRACMIQGTQQVYVVALWYWGSALSAIDASGQVNSPFKSFATSTTLAYATTPIALILWLVGILILIGLPDYYRQAPGKVPSFYIALSRRKIVVWTLVTVMIQNFFMSAPYGRNWQFLWTARAAPAWSIALLVVFFFLILWIAVLFIFARLSVQHSWILPIFAIGLGAPRWCQMLWGTSAIGLYLPWAGSAMSSALVSRSLWLWLGLLDTIQGVGFGMIFLQTLTRIHVAFTLLAAQVIGSVVTIVARLIAPNNTGPGDVFPDFSAGAIEGLSKAWFWVALAFQILVCVGFLKFFRKEQLNKP